MKLNKIWLLIKCAMCLFGIIIGCIYDNKYLIILSILYMIIIELGTIDEKLKRIQMKLEEGNKNDIKM